MIPSQLLRQKIAGFVMPIIVGWFLIFLVPYLIFFVSFNSEWIFYLLCAAGISLIPMVGYGMGIMNVYYWRHQSWSEQTRKENSVNLLIYFWVLFPTTYVLIASIFGILVFPVHVLCFFKGQKLGLKWIETDMLNQFLGKSNEWERKELE